MIIRQGFKFRLYPEPQQRRVLACWWGGKRYVANLALEQRRAFSRRGRSLAYAKQAGDLKALRAELPWLAEVPNQILQQGLVDLDRAFQNFFEGRAGYPKPLGIDFGTRQDWTASTGHVFDVPGLSQGEQRRKLCLERGIARQVEMRKKLGHQHRSRREGKRRAALRRLQGRETRRAHDALHKYTIDLAGRYALIGIEDLNIKNMTASAAGTLEEPGRNVAAKSGLNREMRHGRFGMGRRMLGYKSEWHGGRVVMVPPAYTSQTCSACEKRPTDHPETRHLEHGRDGERFRCPLCGHEEDADINAARNIQREALRLAAQMDQALPVPAQPRRERPKGVARFKNKLSTAGGLPVEARGALGASQAVNREVASIARC